MNLNEKQLCALAESCRIALTENERERLIGELNELLSLADRLPCAKEKPTSADTVADAGALREDAAAPCLSRNAALANSDSTRDGFFCVPRAVGSNS